MLSRHTISFLGALALAMVAFPTIVLAQEADSADTRALGLKPAVPAQVLASPAPANTTGATTKRLALVIGNAKYKEAPLRNPVNDAHSISVALRQLGFEVIVLSDSTQKEMLRAVTLFGERLSADSVALFYYAGHGMQVRGRNYLIPVDAQINSEGGVKTESVDVDAVLDQFTSRGSRLNLVILDACRNNPFERLFRGSSGGLAQIDAPQGTLIAYATAPGKVASDGDGPNGLYTAELLKAIHQPGLKIEDVFKQVRINVTRVTGGLQTPWESSSLTGDFYFTGGLQVAVAAEPARGEVSVELAFWDSVKSSTNAADYRAYLERFPKGNFVPLARGRLQQFEAATAYPHAGVWEGRIETYGGLFERPVTLPIEVKVVDERVQGSIHMYNETRTLTGTVDRDGNLVNTRLEGSVQKYDLIGKLWEAHGEGRMGWKLKMTLKRRP